MIDCVKTGLLKRISMHVKPFHQPERKLFQGCFRICCAERINTTGSQTWSYLRSVNPNFFLNVICKARGLPMSTCVLDDSWDPADM